MNTKSKIMTLIAAYTLTLSAAPVLADEERSFKAIGQITENSSDHTTEHEHQLQFVRLSDGEKFDIVDSPALLAAHCQNEQNPVVEVEGYRTGKVLFWGGDLVVTDFKVHNDIEVPKAVHARPSSNSNRMNRDFMNFRR